MAYAHFGSSSNMGSQGPFQSSWPADSYVPYYPNGQPMPTTTYEASAPPHSFPYQPAQYQAGGVRSVEASNYPGQFIGQPGLVLGEHPAQQQQQQAFNNANNNNNNNNNNTVLNNTNNVLGSSNVSKKKASSRKEKEKGRKNVTKACHACKKKKSKCEGKAPCAYCKENGVECEFEDNVREKKDKDLLSLRKENEELVSALARKNLEIEWLRSLLDMYDIAYTAPEVPPVDEGYTGPQQANWQGQEQEQEQGQVAAQPGTVSPKEIFGAEMDREQSDVASSAMNGADFDAEFESIYALQSFNSNSSQ